MSELPERIIAQVDYDGDWDGPWCEPGREPIGVAAYWHAEYIRADLHQKALDRIDALEAENKLLRGAVAEAVYLLDPEAEDILKGACIYRIVLAYELSGGFLPDDLKDALQKVREKSEA